MSAAAEDVQRAGSQPDASRDENSQLALEKRRADEALRASEQRERAARADMEHARRRLELLASAGAILSRSLEPQATLDAIASIVVPHIADWCRVDLLDHDGVLQRALTYHADPEKSRYGTELVARLRAAPEARGSMGWAVATGQSHLANFSPPAEFDRLRDRDLLTFADAIGMRAYFVVPLIARGRTLGALAALQAESGRNLSEDDCALIGEIAQRAALALDNARLYADAEAARRQAESASRAKDEFLAILGHELRNPLAPIVTALHLMQARGDTQAAPERGIIGRQVAHLSRLVDDLLDVSRITKGKIVLKLERVDVADALRRAAEQVGPMVDEHAVRVEWDLPAAPVPVMADPLRLAQIFGNLLSNAVKFTAAGGLVRLAVTQTGTDIEVVVADSGVGIAPELLPAVFDLFVQGKQSIDRREGGLGLGLTIVRTLVGLHGGRIVASSDGHGKGSTFRVTLPCAPATEVPASVAAPAPHPRTGGRVLLVDDNEDAAESTAALLRYDGFEVRAVGDGEAALAMLADFRPDVAVLDIGLPGMSGYDLAVRLRTHPAGAHVRLVALTGYGAPGDVSRTRDAGFDEHLVKPVMPQRLLDVLARLAAG